MNEVNIEHSLSIPFLSVIWAIIDFNIGHSLNRIKRLIIWKYYVAYISWYEKNDMESNSDYYFSLYNCIS